MRNKCNFIPKNGKRVILKESDNPWYRIIPSNNKKKGYKKNPPKKIKGIQKVSIYNFNDSTMIRQLLFLIFILLLLVILNYRRS